MTVRDLLLSTPARSLLAGAGALAVLAAVTLGRSAPKPVGIPTLALHTPPPLVATSAVAHEEDVADAEPVDPRDSLRPLAGFTEPEDFAFVVEIGGIQYIRLARGEDVELPGDTARAKLVVDDYVTSAIVPLRVRDLPERLRAWRGRKVIVGGTCVAKVVGFVEIARVSGDPVYVSDDRTRSWTVDATYSSGSTMIAGRLDLSCGGSWARPADRPAIARAVPLDDTALDEAARAAFLASSHAAEIADAWRAASQAGEWVDHASLDVVLVKHSVTGARWAYVHANRSGACGEHGVNRFAVYQISDAGALTEVDAGELPGRALEDLVDLNGDGWFERLVIEEDDADRSLIAPLDADAYASIGVPFHGCGC